MSTRSWEWCSKSFVLASKFLHLESYLREFLPPITPAESVIAVDTRKFYGENHRGEEDDVQNIPFQRGAFLLNKRNINSPGE